MSQYTWTNPAGARRSTELRSWVAPIALTIIGGGATPFHQTDYPNPRGYTYSVALRTHLDQTRLNLLGQDQFFSGPGVGPDYDYPNPTLRRNLSLGILSIGDGPRIALLNSGVPFAQSDYPNPLVARRAIDLRTWWQDLTQSTLAPSPFYQTDYPNPRVYGRVMSLRSHVDAVRLQLIGKDVFFGAAGQGVAQLDWPLPPRGARPAIDLRTWAQDLVRTTLAPAVAPPFHQTDYPNPRACYIYSVAFRSFVDPVIYRMSMLTTTWTTPPDVSGTWAGTTTAAGVWSDATPATGIWTTKPNAI